MDRSTISPEFWNHTYVSNSMLENKDVYLLCRFHEMGFYDVPAMTSFILKETGHPQLSYVGHSMGTTMFFVFCSTRPELQSRIRQMHALAPVAFMSRLKSPIRKVAPFARLLQVRLCAILYNSAAN
jgi:pimeloyl-ACP methyl ester carboxylesterase